MKEEKPKAQSSRNKRYGHDESFKVRCTVERYHTERRNYEVGWPVSFLRVLYPQFYTSYPLTAVCTEGGGEVRGEKKKSVPHMHIPTSAKHANALAPNANQH